MEKSILVLTILLLSGIAMATDDQSFEMQDLEKETDMKLKDEIARFKQEILEEIRMRDEIATEKLVSCCTPLVTFTADTPRHTKIPSGQAVVFSHVVRNLGEGYNANTGSFTAPYAGLYQFTVHVCNVEDRYVVYSILHNGSKVAATVQAGKFPSCSSYTALVIMRRDDKVGLEATWDTAMLYENIYRHNAFMGVLLNAHLH